MGVLALSLLLLANASAASAGHAALAQEPAAALAGIVRDATGAPIPGVTVQLIHSTTGLALDAVTDAAGGYRFDSVPPGSYRLESSLDGFERASRLVELSAGTPAAADVTLELAGFTEGVVVTARRMEEAVQDVPIPLSVVSGGQLAETGAFNVSRLKELVPTVQFYSTNPRNSSVNIRGIGSPFGLTNDGIEPGVGMYIDGVFHARPAAATMDFIDVERVEVLRGPQGTLFGKNTTAGAISITTKKPTFTTETDFELNYGNVDFVQAKGSISGRLLKNVAGRLSFATTHRDGVVWHTGTGSALNTLSNLGARGQLMYAPSDDLAVTLAIDHTRQRPEGFTQVLAGVAPTLRPANRQFAQIAADLGYTPPSLNAFDRLTDVDTAMRSYQDLGGTALVIDKRVGPGRLNSTTAWRYWDWKPSNDRDFTGLPITTQSAAPSFQQQWTQELRYSGDVTPRLNLVAGAFLFRQALDADPSFRQEQGAAAARFLLAPSANAATPGLLDGYGFTQQMRFRNVSAALFGQASWALTGRLRLLPGVRVNYDRKSVDFDQQVYGGLQTSNAALVALQRSVLAPQAYEADVDDGNLSGQLTAAYEMSDRVNLFATVATGFKSIGLNLNGVPTDAADRPVLSAATVAPERVRHVEFGMKSAPFARTTVNVTTFQTDISDYQAQVVNASVGVLRGYLANAEHVRVRGVEVDTNARVNRSLSVYASAAFTDGVYVSFPDAPPPLEETGGPASKDISGSTLPGISKWAVSYGGEYVNREGPFARFGELVAGADVSYRSSFSSSPSVSRYLMVDSYSLLNARVGLRRSTGWAVTLWGRNLLDTDYLELLSAAPGNTGLIVGQPGDFRTYGVTVRLAIR